MFDPLLLDRHNGKEKKRRRKTIKKTPAEVRQRYRPKDKVGTGRRNKSKSDGSKVRRNREREIKRGVNRRQS